MSEQEHKHGSMDISVHEKTFEGFITLTVRGVCLCVAVLILLYLFNG